MEAIWLIASASGNTVSNMLFFMLGDIVERTVQARANTRRRTSDMLSSTRPSLGCGADADNEVFDEMVYDEPNEILGVMQCDELIGAPDDPWCRQCNRTVVCRVRSLSRASIVVTDADKEDWGAMFRMC